MSITDYNSARELAQTRKRKLANNTYLTIRDDGSYGVKLHNTEVVIHYPDRVVLNSGGWKTVTTKDRINTFSPYHIWQEKRVWLVEIEAQIYEFADGMTIYSNGEVEGAHPVNDTKAAFKESDRLCRQVRNYTKAFIEALDAGKVPPPSAGDCWGCLMVADDGSSPLGGPDHMRSHLEEKYFVPSLVQRAIDRYPVSMAAKAYLSDKWAGTDNGAWLAGIGREQVRKSLYRFVLAELGQAG